MLLLINSCMFKQRIVNGSIEKSLPQNPMSLHSLLKNYLESSSVPKSYKDVLKGGSNIEYQDAD